MNKQVTCLLFLFIFFFVTTAFSNGISNPKVKWKFKTHGPVRAAVAVAGKHIYFGSADGYLYAIDKGNASLQWKFKTEGAISNTPAVTESLILVSSRDNNLYAINRLDGTLAWKFQMQPLLPAYTEWEYFMSAPVATGKMILAGSGDGHLYALDHQGKELWKFKTGARIRATPLVHEGKIYQPSNDGMIYVLSAEQGKLLWSFQTQGALLDQSQGFDRTNIFARPCIKDNVLVIASRDGKTYGIDINTKKEKWTFSYGSTWAISTAINDQTVYVGWSTNNKFCALDLQTGQEKWRHDCQAMAFSTATFHGDQVIFGSADGNLYSLNKMTGEKFWQYTTGSEIHASPIYDEGTLYVGCDDGYLYALEEGEDKIYTAVYQPLSKSAAYPVVDMKIAPYLKDQGFKVLDSAKLYRFVKDRIKDKAPSVIVFAYDVIPENIVGDAPERGMMRQYLEAGGKVIWFGWVPNIFRFTEKGNFSGGRDLTIASRMLDVTFASPEESGNYYSSATQDGLNWGLPTWFKSTHSVVSAEGVTPLAFDEYNRVSVWLKKFNPRAGSGFVSGRTWAYNVPMKEEDLKLIHHLALYGLE